MSSLRRRILLVEDSPSDQQIICAHLEHDGAWDVESVTTWREAVEVMERGSFDAVLLDLRLPDAEGLGMVAELGERFDVPVVLLTGTAESAWGTDVLSSGAQDYLHKDDITTGSLGRALRHALQRHANTQELQRTQRRLARYARAIAHDLRSPLASVRGFAELISVEEQSRGGSGGRVEAYAGRIVAQVKRLESMVTDLLEDSAQDGGDEVDLTQAARWVQDLLGGRLDRTGATMTVTRLPRVRGTTTVLRQVMLNLTGNALDHAKADPVEMRWTSRRRQDGGWDVVLEDNGTAVPQALLDQGQPMAPVEIRATTDGHGIGLQVAANGMDEHGGELWLSRGRSGGLMVTMAFPPEASIEGSALGS